MKTLIACLVFILCGAANAITLPLSGGSNTDPAMVANPRIDLSRFAASSSLIRNMADIHDRFATYLFDRAARLGCDPAALAAVIYVESGGRGFSGSRMIIRFENHVFRPKLNNDALFYDHFTYDATQNWLGHTWRASTSDPFTTFHGDQNKEWTVLQFAQGLNDLAAINSASYGAPQIMGFNAESIGYSDARAMFLAFSNSLQNQMDGMISFIRGRSGCLNGLRTNDFVQFASCYNGNGQAQAYGANIQAAHDAYLSILNTLQITPPTKCQFDGLFGACDIPGCNGEEYAGVSACGAAKCCIAEISCGNNGRCMDQTRCLAPGQAQSGLCTGGSSIKCCIGGPTRAPVTAAPVTNAPVTVSCSYEGLTGTCSSNCVGSNVFGYTDTECPGTNNKCCVPAQSCSPSAGVSGVCKDIAFCSGSTFSGLCPGSSAIKCCVESSTTATPTRLPTQAITATPTRPPSSSAPTRLPTQAITSTPTRLPTTRNPTASPTRTGCSPDGGVNKGVCQDVSTCTNGKSFTGLCPGPTNIQCCVPTAAPTRTPTSRTPTLAPTPVPTQSCTYEGLTGYCSSTNACSLTGTSSIAYATTTPSCGFCCAPAPSCSTGGTCMDTARCQAGSTILSGLCPGSAKIKCCIPSGVSAQAAVEEQASTNVSVAAGVPVGLIVLGSAITFIVYRRRKSLVQRELTGTAAEDNRWSVVAGLGQSGDNPMFARNPKPSANAPSVNIHV